MILPGATPSPPTPPAPREVTELLLLWRQGDTAAAERLAGLVYEELRRLAHSYMRRESAEDLLQTTALVNEAFIRLVDVDVRWEDRSHFFGICAQLMRRVLVDYARRRRAEKRGGPAPALRLGDYEIPAQRADHLVALDDALRDLEQLDRRKGKVVEMCYFGGMTTAEIAQVLEISQRSVERDLRLARAWVADALKAAS
ncbi:MAG: sigma-70 family RNA polymerase sigma factor [Acidobacteria bacterium]|nr:sigma-70 family RNA polymerase sigma factor [Acidobacteriota bacterium]